MIAMPYNLRVDRQKSRGFCQEKHTRGVAGQLRQELM